MITVLVVDDSAFFRNALKRMLSEDPEIQIVGIARDGQEALEQIRLLKPDVVTLDVEMPKMDGLATLQVIMSEMPRPVIMVSSLTVEGAVATLKAMELGAVDYIPKYQGTGSHLDLNLLSQDLCSKVKAVGLRAKRFPLRPRLMDSGTQSVRTAPSRLIASPPTMGGGLGRSGRQTRDYVGIGVSTGGPPAVQKVLSALPADFPACIFIAQHMPGTFTGPFAKRLDSVCKIRVKEAENGDRIQNGVAYIAPGGKHLRVDVRGTLPHLSVVTDPADALYKPSATVLLDSLAQGLGSRSIGVIMTGMGSDGCEGMKALKRKGGYVLAQNEASCVVYGMPKAVVDAGIADEVVDIDSLADAIMAALYK